MNEQKPKKIVCNRSHKDSVFFPPLSMFIVVDPRNFPCIVFLSFFKELVRCTLIIVPSFEI